MSNTIRRSEALRQMETKEKSVGQAAYFGIQFYKRNGELVSIGRARITGLRANMKEQRLRGIQAVDHTGNPLGHIYPVSIDNIRTFNNLQVTI
ncbi:hypothetical protein LJC68_06190 [Bacteroidales bacterium OttesenSCG-928-B11]|nr:hypothetical protein [Bacteroidales bacterium OttesenSCG-928-B11]